MNSTQSSTTTRLKVGIFTLIGFVVIVLYTVLANNRPFWWRPCQFVKINVEDATGLKTKAPIRSLGIEIGYLKSVNLTETHVNLGICITAPVEVLPDTRAYIRGEGFLGDKFVELKPVKYLGNETGKVEHSPASSTADKKLETIENSKSLSKNYKLHTQLIRWVHNLDEAIFPSALAVPPSGSLAVPKPKGGREIPVGEGGQDVQHLVTKVDDLVQQVTNLTDNLKEAINPDELKKTMKQLNQTLENASKTLAPEGGLTQTAQRSLGKLEDAIEQLRDMMTRVNKGEGSVGMLLNDPSYADEIRLAIKNINRLLNKVGEVRFVVDMGVSSLTIYNGVRGWFNLAIWPNATRYYLLGIASDPRGRISNTTVTTTAGGFSQTTQTQVVDQTGILLTGMMGKVFWNRLDLAVGFLYGDGAATVALRLGPNGNESFIFYQEINKSVVYSITIHGDRLKETIYKRFNLQESFSIPLLIKNCSESNYKLLCGEDYFDIQKKRKYEPEIYDNYLDKEYVWQ